jgi:hypothetical protein
VITAAADALFRTAKRLIVTGAEELGVALAAAEAAGEASAAAAAAAAAPAAKAGKTRGTVALESEGMSVVPPEAQPARVQVETAYRDPVEGGKAGGKSYEKKRPVAPASGDKVATEKRTKTSTEDD